LYHFHDESADQNEKNIAGSEVSKQSILPASIDTFLQNPGIDSIEYLVSTGGKIVVADHIYRGRFLLASKNCENNKYTDFATLFLVLQQREYKRNLADVNANKR
jgi:hypothetical protein